MTKGTLSAQPHQLPMEAIANFCAKWHVAEMSLFGSAIKGTSTASSDIDVMVVFEEGQEPTLSDYFRAERELGDVLGRKADMITKAGLSSWRTPLALRQQILREAQIIFSAPNFQTD